MSILNRIRPRTVLDEIRDHSQVIIAIDPGTTESGVVLIAEDTKEIIGSGNVENLQLVKALYRSVENTAVIEQIASFGMAVGSETFETCVWTGRFLEALSGKNSAFRIPRRDAKLHVCHSGKASDANVNQALQDRFGVKGTKKNPGYFFGFNSHTFAAFAVAITFIETEDRSKWEY